MKLNLDRHILKRTSRVTGLGITFLTRDDWRFSVVELKRTKQEIQILSQTESQNDWDAVKSYFKPDIPVVLHLDGVGILLRDAELEGHASENGSSFQSDDSDFIVRRYAKGDGTGELVSIMRTELLQTVLDFCENNGVNVVDLKFGPFPVAAIIPLLPTVSSEVITGRWKLLLKDGKLHSFSANSDESRVTYSIEGELVSSSVIALLAACLQFLSGDMDDIPLLGKPREEYTYGYLLKKGGIVVLGVLLLFLTVNYFVWDNLRSRYAGLRMQVSNNENYLTELSGLESKLKKKQFFVDKYIGNDVSTRFSFYADRLASTLPGSIRLTKMELQQLMQKPKEGKAILYQEKTISVEGTSRHMTAISRWIKRIRSEDWVKEVELVSYSVDDRHHTGNFELEIKF
ncbi:PilN domain-containing protein [Prolixibacter denitrificans]|uniref:Fimbrial assembly protein PilN n=1 Tax=Prolixibacter denitrificans TaxID=1541063 RepID=A0A2P8CDY4_9BACT|nr:PilN domain-containing protein [Prolixibacter denitrificans]PSK83109.1 hypothetical protein CLV93_10439 [Prolixibacter denitrificans]GET22008.1 hypothetical protein JCM18694_22540 [Prolixibacter denitrificans]